MPRDPKPGLNLVIQGQIDDMTFAVEQQVDPATDPQEVAGFLDSMRYQFQRQKARGELGVKVLALQIAHDIVDRAEEQKAEARKGYAMKRAHELASYENAWASSGKRGDFRLTGQQQKCLEAFDRQIQDVGPIVDANVEREKEAIPKIERMIARLKAFIAGETMEMPHDQLDAEPDEPLREAAE